MPSRFSSARHIASLAVLSALGVSLFVLESFVPMPLPFLKIGLANVASLVALVMFSPADMFLVVTVRILVGSLLVGSLFSPAFLVALSGGLCSAAAMSLIWSVGKNVFSVFGISLVGSTVHVTTQLVVVSVLFVRDESLLILIPILLTSGLVGGVVVGWVSSRIVPVMIRGTGYGPGGSGDPVS